MPSMKTLSIIFALVAACLVAIPGCSNDPYRPGESESETFFGSYNRPPSKLDPATAYFLHELRIVAQICEPPLTYHYLERPFKIVPLTAASVPEPVYYDAEGRLTDPDPPSDRIVRVEYTIRLQPGILYRNHPCFARDADGRSAYANVGGHAFRRHRQPSDFSPQATRELRAEDYALQIRRLADPRLDSPALSILEPYIDGLTELRQNLETTLNRERERRQAAAGLAYNREQDERDNPVVIDLMAPDFPGVRVEDDLTFTLTLKRKYPQILYWLCTPFFAPMPREALDFYALPAASRAGFSLNTWPVGTGAYAIETFRPNETIVLRKNPNWREATYPTLGMPEDEANGLLADAGQRIPFIQRQVYRLEKESIPGWHKFLQGYTDSFGAIGDVFDQAVRISATEGPSISDAMRQKGVRLVAARQTAFYYIAFNMKDPVVGGLTPEQAKLRQALSIALDVNEYLDIFMNGRGIPAQGPVPPGIFGYRDGETGINPFVNAWDAARQRPTRQPIESARRLMAEAGYPDGRDADGRPLALHYDHASGADPNFRSLFDWMRRQLGELGVRLQERGSELSRFRERRRDGNWQLLGISAWFADYPDPENFLFLFYGPNAIVDSGGPNVSNYANPEYDALFQDMKTMTDTPERQTLIDRMTALLQRDAPCIWLYHPVSYTLAHDWYRNVKPHQVSYNVMKYHRLDPTQRSRRQAEWNAPVRWPLAGFFTLVLVGALAAVLGRRQGNESKG